MEAMLMKIIFFGSFLEHSAKILDALVESGDITVVGVVTTPPMPAGRKKILQQTPVHQRAIHHAIPVLTPSELTEQSLKLMMTTFGTVDYLVTAGYGKILPGDWLTFPTHGALNLHFSLLPAYRGANPAEWALLMNEVETGVSLIVMSEGIDAGAIIAQARCEIEARDTREILYERLYTLGADMLPVMLTTWHESQMSDSEATKIEAMPQPTESTTPTARRFMRAHGFVDWRAITAAMKGEALQSDHLSSQLREIYTELSLATHEPIDSILLLDRAVRALLGFPGIWTYVRTDKGKQRMKILSTHVDRERLVLDEVQLEGKTKTHYQAIENQVII